MFGVCLVIEQTPTDFAVAADLARSVLFAEQFFNYLVTSILGAVGGQYYQKNTQATILVRS